MQYYTICQRQEKSGSCGGVGLRQKVRRGERQGVWQWQRENHHRLNGISKMKLFLWNNLSRDKRGGEALFNRRTTHHAYTWYGMARQQGHILRIQGATHAKGGRHVGLVALVLGITLERKLDFATKTFANKLNRISKVLPHKFKENVYFASFKLDFFWVCLQFLVYAINFQAFFFSFLCC